jgi:hypothetical protein
MKCGWCHELAEHTAVFGSLITMETWDVKLCLYHADNVRCQITHRDPIWAPLNNNEHHNQSHYADDWLISG